MIELPPDRFRSLLPFVPDSPEATLPVHCLLTGRGEAFVDDSEKPRNLAIRLPGAGPGDLDRLYLYGNPGSADLRGLLDGLEEPTEVFCDPALARLVRLAHGDASPRHSQVFHFDRLPEEEEEPGLPGLRRLRPSDAGDVSGLVPSWAWSAFEGVKDLLMRGAAFGCFEGEALVSAAFLTDMSVKYESISAVTAEGSRRRGHALACARRLKRHSMDRGRLPRAVVTDRNEAGLALAGRLGFSRRIDLTSWFLDVF